jgi:hypothetical protein
MSLDVSVKKKPRKPLLPPGWWRWPLRALAALLALVLSLTTFAWSALKREQIQGCRELEKAIAETDEKDPRWRWHEIQEDLEPIPDDENSIFVIQKVADAAKQWNRHLKTAEGESLLDYSLPVNRWLDAARIARLRDVLSKHEDCIALAASLAKHPRGRAVVALTPNILGTRTPQTDHCWGAADVLALATERLLSEGKFDDAAELVRAMAHVSAALRDDPFWFSQRTRVTIRYLAIKRMERLLATGQLSDRACLRLANHLTTLTNDNPLLDAIRGQRAIFHELFENLYAGRASLIELMMGPHESAWECAQVLAYRYRLPEDHAFLLSRCNEFCDAARLPVGQRWPRWKALNTKLGASQNTAQNQRRCLLAHYALLDALRHADYWTRCDAELSCAVVALAAERFRLAHKRWPASVNELCPVFLPEPLVDPFDGQPLRLKRCADGLVVYSVSADGQDDGGDLDVPQRGPAKDVGFHLFDSQQRGLSPLPRPVRIQFSGLVW